MDINDRIEARKLMLSNIRKQHLKKHKHHAKKMVAKRSCSLKYINAHVDSRNYRAVINDFIDSYNRGFCSSLCLDKIGPLTSDKLNYIMDQGLMIDQYSIMFGD